MKESLMKYVLSVNKDGLVKRNEYEKRRLLEKRIRGRRTGGERERG